MASRRITRGNIGAMCWQLIPCLRCCCVLQSSSRRCMFVDAGLRVSDALIAVGTSVSSRVLAERLVSSLYRRMTLCVCGERDDTADSVISLSTHTHTLSLSLSLFLSLTHTHTLSLHTHTHSLSLHTHTHTHTSLSHSLSLSQAQSTYVSHTHSHTLAFLSLSRRSSCPPLALGRFSELVVILIVADVR